MPLHRRSLVITLVAALLPAVSSAHAQLSTESLPPTRLGLTAGANFARLSGPNFNSGQRRDGFVGGLVLVTPFAPRMAFQLEALYAMKGGVSRPTSTSTATLALDYIEIPVMLRADIPASRSVRPFVYSGPAFNYRVGCGVDASPSFGSQNTSCDELEAGDPTIGTLNRFDVGWIFGGGVAFDAHGRALTIGGRYEFGLRGIASNNDAKNRLWSIVASLEVPLPQR